MADLHPTFDANYINDKQVGSYDPVIFEVTSGELAGGQTGFARYWTSGRLCFVTGYVSWTGPASMVGGQAVDISLPIAYSSGGADQASFSITNDAGGPMKWAGTTQVVGQAQSPGVVRLVANDSAAAATNLVSHIIAAGPGNDTVDFYNAGTILFDGVYPIDSQY